MMADDILSLPGSDSHPIPSKALEEVLEQARADIRKRMGKHPFDFDPAVTLFETKECVLSILYQYPEIFIRNYTSLGPFKRLSLMNEITLHHDRAFNSVMQPHQSQQEFPGIYAIIEEIVDQKAYFNLFDTVFKTATISQIEKLPSTLDIYKGLEKYPSNLLESDQMGKEAPKVQIEKRIALKKFTESAEKFISSSDISDEKIIDDINEAASLIHDFFQYCKKSLPSEEAKAQALKQKGIIFPPKSEEAPQTPDLSDIPLWQGRKRDGMPMDFLKTHYGQHLSVFGAEQNGVFQDQIRAHDRGLIKGLENQLREEGKNRILRDFVKTRSARVDRELENVSAADLMNNPRLASTLYRRLVRAAKATTATRSHSPARK